MRSIHVIVFLSALILTHCKAPNDVFSSVNDQAPQKRQIDIERESYFDPHPHPDTLRVGTIRSELKISKSEYKDYFHQHKDELTVLKYYVDNNYSKSNFIIDRNNEKISYRKLIGTWTWMAYMGDKELEEWLLDFWEEYFNKAIEDDLPRSTNQDKLTFEHFHYFKSLPPSNRKVDIIKNFLGTGYDITHPIYRDIHNSPLYVDFAVYMVLSASVEKKYHLSNLPYDSEQRVMFRQFYEDIVSGKIPLIERSVWIKGVPGVW